MKSGTGNVGRAIGIWLALATAACSPDAKPQVGTQTNWLTLCATDADCGELSCVCGACTHTCDGDGSCSDLRATSCVPAEDPGAIAVCSGAPPRANLCLPRCPEEGCGVGSSCVAGVCTTLAEPTVLVSIDVSERFQSLVGIGGGVGYVNDAIVRHPRKDELFDAMFSETGFGVIRIRNRFVEGAEDDLASTREIVEAARERLAVPPLLFLNSASPPNALKANGDSWCEGNPDTCTLAPASDGGFDYAGLAQHWRGSVEAYAAADLAPDYISIQNNPDWVPPAGRSLEACRFLPTEGTSTVATDSGDVEVVYPGYAEALAAVTSEFSGLDSSPRIVGPETTEYAEVPDYIDVLGAADVDAVGYHMYGEDPTDVDVDALNAVRELGEQRGRPVFQSEMAGDARVTAVLLHAALVEGGSSMFIHNGFVSTSADIDSSAEALISLSDEDFQVGDVHHVMRHYSSHVGAGWTRVSAETNDESLYASAWLSPDDDTLVVVITNPGITPQMARIDLDTGAPDRAAITRTVLSGSERSAELGEQRSFVTMPAQSIATLTFPR